MRGMCGEGVGRACRAGVACGWGDERQELRKMAVYKHLLGERGTLCVQR